MGSYRDFETRGSLGLSYNDLPIELKPCFLYFGLFPEDYEVFTFQLINIWVAEKFIKVVGSVTLEEAGEDYLNDLVARNLIQVASREHDGRIRSCRIHDLLRTLCIEMAEESNFFVTIHKLTSISATRVRRVATACPGGIGDDIEWAHQTPKVRSFLSFDLKEFLSIKQLKNLCRSSRFIRVLIVTMDTGGKCSSACLPNEIGNLIHLSYLEIRTRFYIGFLMFPNTISNLKSLLTLNLQRCHGIVSLPACFRKMKQLRHILLPRLPVVSLSGRIRKQINRSLVLKNLDEISLPNLQTLIGCNGDILKAKGFSKVTRLQKLGIDDFTEYDLSVCKNVSKMQLRYPWRNLPETNKFPPNLTELTLTRSVLKEDSMETLGKLSNLKTLVLGPNSYAGARMVCSRADFPQLQVLEFSYLRNLEELTVEEGGMPCLHKLIIRRCDQLKMLPDRLQNMIVYKNESSVNYFEEVFERPNGFIM